MLEGLGPTAGAQDLVAGGREDVIDEFPDIRLIFHAEDRRLLTPQCWRRLDWRTGCGGFIDAWQKECKRRPTPGCGVYGDVPATLRHNSIDRGQPQSCA